MTQSSPEQDKQLILNNIEQYGCHLVLIEADNYLPAFAYSIGLYQKFGHPEVICFGLKTEVLGDLLNYASELVQSGEKLVTDKAYTGFLEGHDVQFLAVDKAFYQNYLGYGGWFYDQSFDFPVLQLIWPDKGNNLPWNENFNPEWKFKQPLLDRDIDFKFYEEKNVVAYTTKEVLAGKPILYVYHDADGDWQFYGSDDPSPDNAMLVSLESITKLDPSINEIYHLQYGWNAWRQDVNEDWEYAEGEADEEEDTNEGS
ncbi:DUF4262 domain-containing protein [Chitinophaga sp. SYP-B3965]|uniref:DUF4262 domain-containing protein n=1 Tax=Chitinophaga sp. SYP-B3965 TaxID=2663120 RepID=UPI001299543D|nr:DUF4262 domain-containing protein [Chitinophaga sp. SYP-B3965]MRG46017.1 DUF4262 domain-containing protein [Chitinophaga sp. SYP-B3965]